MAYPLTATLVAASDVAELLQAGPAKQDAYRTLAIAGVENHTGQVFDAFVGTRYEDGRGGRELYLTRRLEAVTALAIEGTALDASSVRISERRDRLHIDSYPGNYAVQAMRWSGADTRTFRSGAGTVAITGVWGWSAVPPPVFTAVVWDMEDQARADQSALAGTVSAYRRMGLNEIVQGNLRATLGRSAPQLSPRAAALLSDFIWRGPGGYLV